MKRTADGYKNTMKKLRAEFDDIKVAIGQELMKALLPAARALKDFLEAAGGGARFIRTLGDRIKAVAEVLWDWQKTAAKAVFPIIIVFERMWNTLMDIINVIRNADGSFRKMAAGGVELLKEKFSGLIYLFERIRELVRNLAAAWKALMEGDFSAAWKLAGKTFVDVWDDAIAKIKKKYADAEAYIKDKLDRIAGHHEEAGQKIVDDDAETKEVLKYNEEDFTRWLEAEHKKREKALRDAQAERTKIVKANQKAVVGAMADTTAELGQMWLDLNQAKLDAETSAQIASIRQSDMSEKEKANAIAAIKIDQWNAEKKAARAQARMDYAVSIMKAFRQLGPIGGALAAVALTAAWAAQEQMIDQTPKPEFPTYQRGGIAGLHGPELAMVGEAGPELVIPAGPTREIMQGGDTNSISVGSGAIVINVDGGSPGAVRREVEMAMRGIADDVGRGSFFRE
jgi:hypothetical protein